MAVNFKEFDLSASDALIMEAVNYAIHAGWLILQQKWHGDLYPTPADDFHRNIHPRVLKNHIVMEDIGGNPAGEDEEYVASYDWPRLFRFAVAHAIVTADHRENPVNFQMRVWVEGAGDSADKSYKGHWHSWRVEGEMIEIETGKVTKLFVKSGCLEDRTVQVINGERVLGHRVSIPYFTQEQQGLNS